MKVRFTIEIEAEPEDVTPDMLADLVNTALFETLVGNGFADKVDVSDPEWTV